MARKLLVVHCHPNPRSYTRAVCDAVLAGLADGRAEVRLTDLYAERFDPVLIVDDVHRRRDLGQVEYTRPWRDHLAWCDAVVLVYPVWWGGPPAMLKGWLDRVLVSGLAYSFEGRPRTAVLPEGRMRGKEVHCFYTLDSPWWVAWLDPGWLSLSFTVFRYCGFSVVRRHWLSRLRLRTDEERAAWLVSARSRAARIAADGVLAEP